MEKFFKLKQYGTDVRTEVLAGLTTFFTMAYIIFVNPQVLSMTGMDKNGVYIATIIATVVGTLIMALVANVPYALAPGMGLNAFFTYTVCFTLGFKWQQALALVFICGIINIIITVTQVRKSIIKAIPKSLQAAIGGGIGLFIAYIGLKDANLIKFTIDPGHFSLLPNNDVSSFKDITGVTSDGSAVPALVNFSSMSAILAVIGIIIMVVLLVRKVKGAILIGILLTTIIGIPMGVTKLSGFSFNPGDMISSITAVQHTAFKLDFAGLFPSPDKILLVLTTVISFSLSDTFDTIGTFIGTGRKSGIFDDKDELELFNGKGFSSRMDRALFADSTATSIGALFGTSNTTTYVESSAGIAAGGRTGLTSVVTAIMFALCILLAPFIGLVPTVATAPALIVVGVMMMTSFTDINWSDFEEAAPVFLTAIMMPFAYSITTGIAFGFIFYTLIKMFKGKFKEVHPILYIVSALFILNYIYLAVDKL